MEKGKTYNLKDTLRQISNEAPPGNTLTLCRDARYVVESYYNESTGDFYRIWNDGWLEQGGFFNANQDTWMTVPLLKPYKDNRYTIQMTLNSAYSDTVNNIYHTIKSKTTTNFMVYGHSKNGLNQKQWYACGMGKEKPVVAENGSSFISSTGVNNGGGGDSPVGSIIAFAGNVIPEGYLVCNGQEVSRTTYVDLFETIGITYGQGNGSSTFNLPKLDDDRFLQGSSLPGSKIDAGLPNITGTIRTIYTQTGNNADGAFTQSAASKQNDYRSSEDRYVIRYQFDASKSNPIYGRSTTVQPKALTVIYLIKATKTNSHNSGSSNNKYVSSTEISKYSLVEANYDKESGSWYRLYADGWVEQGGILKNISKNKGNIIFLKRMNDTSYNLQLSSINNASDLACIYKTETDCTISVSNNSSNINWTVSGMSSTKPAGDADAPNNFTIIYPNNGSKAAPANVAPNSRYIEKNPFPGYYIDCKAEIYCDGQWGETGWYTDYANNKNRAYGTRATVVNDNIVIHTGATAIVGDSPNLTGGGIAPSDGALTNPRPCRVKVWKIGKVNYDQ